MLDNRIQYALLAREDELRAAQRAAQKRSLVDRRVFRLGGLRRGKRS